MVAEAQEVAEEVGAHAAHEGLLKFGAADAEDSLAFENGTQNLTAVDRNPAPVDYFSTYLYFLQPVITTSL